ncbi:MAG TPA: phosphoribosylglycinamide formyltransferase [Nitrolancea sp.]|nr:phosphoribosylglycinamide formyltransferase [Nitrolancea sp.]
MNVKHEKIRTADRPLRIVVLLSGTGRTLENLLIACKSGTLSVDVARVISTRRNVRGNDVARNADIPLSIIPRREFETPERFSDAVLETIGQEHPGLVVMAGFLSKIAISDELVGRVMNIHPALLPMFGGLGHYGQRVHEQVLASGMKISGCTAHFVDDEYDAGPIIAQACVPVLDDDDADSLAARVFARECELYPRAIRLFAENRLRIEGRRVRVLPAD